MLLNGKNYSEILTETKTIKGKTVVDARCYDINMQSLNDCETEISLHHSYGSDDRLLFNVINAYPDNNDVNIVAMKIALVDVTNSTHLSQHKDKVSIYELADYITKIDFDKRVSAYDKTLVPEIASFNSGSKKEINLFSFASKYCYLHNSHIHGGDDYPKYDGIIAKCLPVYLGMPQYSIGRKITRSSLENIRKSRDYDAFKSIIDDFIAKIGLSHVSRIRSMIDHFIWYTNR